MKNSIHNHLKSIWQDITDELSLYQYRTLMGGDMSFRSKAERALKVSKSKTVQKLCYELISVYDSHYSMKALTVSNQDFSEFD